MTPVVLHWSKSDMDLFLADLDTDLTHELATRALARLSVADAIDAATQEMNAEQLREAVALIVGYLAELEVGEAAE